MAEKELGRTVSTDECVRWSGRVERDGYGRTGKRLAHRVTWERCFGPIPTGMHVLHRCDNPPCVNPEHLFLGTHAENMLDMKLKGRSPRKPSYVRVTMDQIREIRRIGWSQATKKTGEQFGICASQVRNILHRRHWANVE